MIVFTKSPTGLYNLGYNAGDEASLSADLEKKLIEAGLAIQKEEPQKTKK